jgi:ligand-binding sensor protein
MNDFVVFILSHGRANNIYTLNTLRKCGYTGKVVFIVDNEDESIDEYFSNFKDVEVFDKLKISKTFDEYDNFQDRRAIIYARNVCFEIAKKLGYKYFIQMDDDYTYFEYRIYNEQKQKPQKIKNLDSVLLALLDFYKSTPFSTISIAQGGDFIGGKHNNMAKKPTIYRKCMNSFICSVDKPFQFVGRINEDVNTYTKKQSIGLLMGTIPMIALGQKTTQKNNGGMSDLYLDSGTYVKSFYSVIGMPSSVHIKPMGDKHMRLHHAINWNCTVPKILSPEIKKTEIEQ